MSKDINPELIRLQDLSNRELKRLRKVYYRKVVRLTANFIEYLDNKVDSERLTNAAIDDLREIKECSLRLGAIDRMIEQQKKYGKDLPFN